MDNMNRQQQFAQGISEVPQCFHEAVCGTLDHIVALERQEKRNPRAFAQGMWRGRNRRALALALLASLLVGTAAFAAYHWQLFDSLSIFLGPAPQTADQVMQRDLAHVTVNGVDIAVREAGYDGKTLFIHYTYHMKD